MRYRRSRLFIVCPGLSRFLLQTATSLIYFSRDRSEEEQIVDAEFAPLKQSLSEFRS
jgi:hypothetical protein